MRSGQLPEPDQRVEPEPEPAVVSPADRPDDLDADPEEELVPGYPYEPL